MLNFLRLCSSALFGKLSLRLRKLIGLPPRLALYARHSSGDTTGLSFERQLQQVKDYGASLGGNICQVYVDAGGHFRTPLANIAAAARRGDFDVLVVQDVDRLTRDFTKFAELTASGVRIHSVRDGGPAAFISMSWTRSWSTASIRDHRLFNSSIAYPPVKK
jgi:hypothetical protein